MTQADPLAAMDPDDPMADQVLDGNAVGGMMAVVFGADMTGVPGRCAHCHTVNMLGAMRAYTRAPGVVLRCPACGNVVVRMVQREGSVYIDARGISYFRFVASEASSSV